MTGHACWWLFCFLLEATRGCTCWLLFCFFFLVAATSHTGWLFFCLLCLLATTTGHTGWLFFCFIFLLVTVTGLTGWLLLHFFACLRLQAHVVCCFCLPDLHLSLRFDCSFFACLQAAQVDLTKSIWLIHLRNFLANYLYHVLHLLANAAKNMYNTSSRYSTLIWLLTYWCLKHKQSYLDFKIDAKLNIFQLAS